MAWTMAWWTNTGQSDVHRRSAQRELLELFGLGERNHTEVDVQAAAVVLTGWTTARRQRSPRFVSRRHTGTSAHRHIGTSAHHKRCSVRPASTTSDRSSTPSSTIRLTQASLQTASSPSKRATSPTPTRSSASATTSLHCSSGRSSAGTTRIQAPARRLLNLRGQSQGRRSQPCSAAAHSEH